MSVLPHALMIILAASTPSLGPGDHHRLLKVGELDRSYLVHVPPRYDPKQPTPVVVVLHGAAMNGSLMVPFCGLNKKADEAGFITVYPDGTGLAGILLTWNAGAFPRGGSDKKPDDVAFIAKLLDELATLVHVDPQRVYVTGMSNGGMMCYRVAAELSDRIAAIAPVAGTMVIDKCDPKWPVSVIHFHGTKDTLVPFNGFASRAPRSLAFKSIDETIKTWAKIDGCPEQPQEVKLPNKTDDGTTVAKRVYGPGKDGAEVVLVVIDGGGHTWPGQEPPVRFIGKSTKQISANDMIWEFFEKHPMKRSP
jgi:polyhydroxybutyrate depolymerase